MAIYIEATDKRLAIAHKKRPARWKRMETKEKQDALTQSPSTYNYLQYRVPERVLCVFTSLQKRGCPFWYTSKCACPRLHPGAHQGR